MGSWYYELGREGNRRRARLHPDGGGRRFASVPADWRGTARSRFPPQRRRRPLA